MPTPDQKPSALDLSTIDAVDDVDAEDVLVNAWCTANRKYVWAWVSRDELFDAGRDDIAQMGLPRREDEEVW